MEKKPKKQRFYTFMIIPHDARGGTVSFKVPAFWVYGGVSLLVFAFLVVGSSLVYSSLLSRRLVNYYTAIAKNREQQKMINSFSLETQKVNRAISELENSDNELRRMLGLRSWKSKIRLSDKINGKSDNFFNNLKTADVTIQERKASLAELKNHVETVRQRFSATPSCWPLYGRIASFFGYRIFPWSGFHSGIDIDNSYGAAIKSTADGVVAFAGWQNGYGRTIIVDHGYGISTLYGHCSRFEVKVGQPVKKGAVICYVGTTGYTTGPHVHYEVRRNDRAVNPMAYLNMNLLTACRIWR